MTDRVIARLPDLTSDPGGSTGWVELDSGHVVVPSLADAHAGRGALTLEPGIVQVAPTLGSPPAGVAVLPPLIAVDRHGCVIAAKSVDGRGRVLMPRPDGGADLLQSCRGGRIKGVCPSAGFIDAIFWGDVIAVATQTGIWIDDPAGPPPTAPLPNGPTGGAVLAISDDGDLIIIQASQPNVTILRRDGTSVTPPATFDERGWYARHRSAAFTYDPVTCTYGLDPARVGSGCCVTPARPLTDDESLFFRFVDDLPDLRKRVAYPASGWAILGSASTDERSPLDSGRPGTRWHRIALFGEIPSGTAVQIETRAADDPFAGDPLLTTGWSRPVTVSAASGGAVEAPFDTRTAAGEALVLAGPGRFLWIRLTLMSNGAATPRISSIEVEREREGTARYLPKAFRDSTPEDDFLRRWLALFEQTAWNGIARRMEAYPELFDPRTTPESMLPYLADWLELPLFDRVRTDPNRLRSILSHADEIAEARGTIDGLILIVKLYLGITIQIVETFHTRSRFILGVDGCAGPELGCGTILTVEHAPTWLDDHPALDCSFLLDDEERNGTIPHGFVVLVPARDVCSSEVLSLLRALIDAEKPAHTAYRIRKIAPAGWVIGEASVVGQEVSAGFDRHALDPATYGLVLGNGPPRPLPLGEGLVLGFDSRLPAESGSPAYRLEATVGVTTRLGA